MNVQPRTVAYLGNFGPSHSTETHVALALEDLGHRVLRIQEGRTPARDVAKRAADAGADVLLWTQTLSLAHEGGTATERQQMLDDLAVAGIPTVGYHLDRWWGLRREGQIAEEPFFAVDLLCTADGGHDDRWADMGIDHVWMPPGVAAHETGPAEPDPRFVSDVAFIGNWTGRYHPEWRHRRELVRFLRREYRGRVGLWPKPGEGAIRGADLQALYASVKVCVGDSCLVGDASRYWSDRIPETLGRGGFLLHPWVDGIDDHYIDGKHLRMWQLGDWRQLRALIGYYLDPDHDHERAAIAQAGRDHVAATATYTVRMRELFGVLESRGMLR